MNPSLTAGLKLGTPSLSASCPSSIKTYETGRDDGEGKAPQKSFEGGQTGHQLDAPGLTATDGSITSNYQTGHDGGGRKRGPTEIGKDAGLVEGFLDWEVLRGCRGQGIKDLRYTVVKFMRWLEAGGLEVVDLDRRVARSYQAHLMESLTVQGEELAHRTVKAYCQAASRLSGWLVETGKIPANPFLKMPGPRMPKTVLHDVPKERDLQKFLDALGRWESVGSDPRYQGRRYIAHVVAELQYASGLRVSEVAALEVGDIDLIRRVITVREGKAGRTRYAYIAEYTAHVLEIYLTQMRPLVLTGKQAHNRHLVFGCGFNSLGHSQNAHLEEVGLEVGVTIRTHAMRHALGYHLLRNGCPLRHIQQILGHVNIKDTEIYTKVDVPKVQEVVDACHPRGIRNLSHGS